MPDEADSAALCEAIADGTFPQSEQLLTSELSAETIPLLLEHISKTRSEISEEIKAASEDDAGDVDEWIAQAKRVQEDIARCKEESKRIVEEHQHVQALRDEATDYERKVELLEAEIDFTETLRRELDPANTATAALREVEDCLLEGNPSAAAAKIQELDKKTEHTVRSRTSTILRDLRDELRLKARVQLETKLNFQISVHRDQHEASITVRPDELDGSATNSAVLLRALDQLGDPHDSLEPLTDKLKGFVLQPLRQSSRLRMTTYEVGDNSIRIQLGREGSSTETAFDFVLAFLKFLQSSVASTIRLAGAKAIMSDLMTLLVNDWLNPGLPTDLTMLDGLDDLQARVRRLLKELESLQWEGQKQLQDWIEDIPRAWLNKRKAATLDAVRKAFVTSKGSLRQVERVEREIMPTRTDEHGGKAEGETNDWDANWDDDNKEKQPSHESGEAQEDEDASGWGFDDEDDTDSNDKANDEDKDGGDAWGWGDDSPVETKSEPPSKDDHKQPNGAKDTKHEEQEITLTELYSITDIPDHLVQIIGQDISDAQTILETGHDGLDSSSASRGLLALPTLALAMFRATAPSYYGASPSLTDIHRYNDSLYIAERLRGISVDSRMLPNVESDIKAMEKFARLAYSKEMETQRLIVWDLLEGAQGFTSCTQFPYSQEIENAVSAVVDRIRAIHINWKPILSTSALMQSIGSLVTMVIGKVVDSIEEMEDISEPESRRLTAFCQQIASLDDLFLSSPKTSAGAAEQEHEHEHEPVPMTAVYVTNWLKFQYLINILESSLVDIKYLWTEGELSLEFSAEEVVDLIRALFAESAHRRSAIASIKGGRNSR
ncbi:ribosome biogenesis protein ytm1 [Exophiala xenobiotica]|nr:ribosome biogenesis protein ytm1 [Exophiala xenobiotica]